MHMSEIRALIVDDEPLARRGVRQLLKPHGDVRVVGEARDGRNAVRMIEMLRPDLLFLDVQMPERDGFGVLARTAAVAVQAVVFLTAYEEHAVRAFDVEAVDYLVKPLSRSRFNQAMDRVRRRLTQGNVAPSIGVSTGSGELLLRAEEIDWIEADDYYAAIHARGRRFLVRESLVALERRLPEGLFMRVHRCGLVNLACVRSFEAKPGGRGVLRLHTGESVPVSRRRRTRVKAWLRDAGSGRHGAGDGEDPVDDASDSP
jgi:two-component system LytT family response regulator